MHQLKYRLFLNYKIHLLNKCRYDHFIFRLPVTKVVIRGAKTNAFYDNNNTAEMQTSPTAAIEDTSTSPSHDIDNRLKTLQIQSRS